ncbi:hypothetical protein GCM10009425_40740 [Pseudomonas asuensis]|uniref:Uncharacterized protein n=1 Tax=Pseudomonas asuensis TaxID=1825787 RepID=A0ABQ2H335_9PSED|nr:hypothetical protein GCM10009425_40740 [Pseudomonas asuensis]
MKQSLVNSSTLKSQPDYAANMALFLLEQEGSVWGSWSGRLTASQQRSLFGRFLGKGLILINGQTETVCNRVKVCFGLDIDDRNITKWRDLT